MTTEQRRDAVRGFASAEEHARVLLGSCRRLLGRPLLEDAVGDDAAERLYRSDIAVLSHGTEQDPIFHYGNAAALRLWETDWESFTAMPSRLSAEPDVRDVREAFLRRVAEQGYADDYSGVRISRTGRRFRIEQAVVWNLIDEEGRLRGQAAAIPRYTRLD